MKKSVIIAILYTIIIVTGPGCSEDKKRNLGYFGYTPLVEDLTNPKNVLTSKRYNFSSIGESCGAGAQCNAIIFQGAGGILGPNYIGFAVNDKNEASPDFKLKVYWLGNSIPTGVNCVNKTPAANYPNLTSSEYIILIEKNGKIYRRPQTGNNLILDIAASGNQYTITFKSDIIVRTPTTDSDTQTINNTEWIVTQKYP